MLQREVGRVLAVDHGGPFQPEHWVGDGAQVLPGRIPNKTEAEEEEEEATPGDRIGPFVPARPGGFAGSARSSRPRRAPRQRRSSCCENWTESASIRGTEKAQGFERMKTKR